MAVGAAMVVGLGGLSACGDSAGPEAGAVTSEDLQGVQEQLGALEQRVGVLEEAGSARGSATDNASGGGAAVADGRDSPLFTDPASLVGQQVTVSADVAELITTTPGGSAFRIAGDGEDEAVAVLSPDQPVQLEVDDVVRVSGTVVQVSRDRFQEDFGVAPGDLFTDVDAFFTDAAGDIAINAGEVQVLQEQAAQS